VYMIVHGQNSAHFDYTSAISAADRHCCHENAKAGTCSSI
jgi:hypothetical protein